MSERLRAAWKQAWRKTEQAQWEYGLLGRRNADSSVTFVVPGRALYLFVTMRHASGAQTVVPARNEAGVPHSADLPVKLKNEQGTYVIYGKATREDLATVPSTPPSGVEVHLHNLADLDDVELVAAAAGDVLAHDGTNWVDTTSIPIAMAATIHAATLDTTPLDADEVPTLNSAGSFALLRTTWTSIKAFLKTYFDTLYELAGAIATHAALTVTHGATGAIVGTTNTQTLTNKTLTAPVIADYTNAGHDHGDADDGGAIVGYIKADGSVVLTAEWDIGEDMAIRAERLEARDAEGLSLQDDGGNLGIFVSDGGNLGIGTADVEAWDSGWFAANIGAAAALMAHKTVIDFYLLGNAYFDGAWKRRIAAEASYYSQDSGGHIFGVAASGAADAAITWITALELTNGRYAGVGISPLAALHVLQPTLGEVVQRLQSTATNDDVIEDVQQSRVATTDATVTTLRTIAIPASTTVFIEARVVARRTGGASGTAEDGAAYIRYFAAKNVAGVATVVPLFAGAGVTYEDQTGWDCTLDVTGSNARVRITGAAGNNITWHATIRTYAVSS